MRTWFYSNTFFTLPDNITCFIEDNWKSFTLCVFKTAPAHNENILHFTCIILYIFPHLHDIFKTSDYNLKIKLCALKLVCVTLTVCLYCLYVESVCQRSGTASGKRAVFALSTSSWKSACPILTTSQQSNFHFPFHLLSLILYIPYMYCLFVARHLPSGQQRNSTLFWIHFNSLLSLTSWPELL